MPIVFVSVDSENKLLHEFKELTNAIDRIYISNTCEAERITEILKGYVNVLSIISTDLLDPASSYESDCDIKNRIQMVVDEAKDSRFPVCMIISHHSVLNIWNPNFIDKEWSII